MATYTVKKGDSLSKIAEKFNTTVSAIQNANKSLIKNVNVINVGWKLTIPETTTTTRKDYATIGKQFEACLNDIKNLASYKKLKSML